MSLRPRVDYADNRDSRRRRRRCARSHVLLLGAIPSKLPSLQVTRARPRCCPLQAGSARSRGEGYTTDVPLQPPAGAATTPQPVARRVTRDPYRPLCSSCLTQRLQRGTTSPTALNPKGSSVTTCFSEYFQPQRVFAGQSGLIVWERPRKVSVLA